MCTCPDGGWWGIYPPYCPVHNPAPPQRLWPVIADGQAALAEAVAETTAELAALHRAVAALQLRADTAEREAGERTAALELACQARVRRAMEEINAPVGARETT